MKKSFTLIEVLVVVAIIAVLVAMLLPALQIARGQARKTYCLNNLRQMTQAATYYTADNDGQFPVGYVWSATWDYEYGWDFFIHWTGPTSSTVISPGWLWMGKTLDQVQQCPSYRGSQTWGRSYTGYNYNVSYIGRGSNEQVTEPARATQVRDPTNCVIFGDGEYYNGPNNYMRSPSSSPYETTSQATACAGTQGYRHAGRTNAAYVDGHAESTDICHKVYDQVGEGTGFLSPDNRLYDLE